MPISGAARIALELVERGCARADHAPVPGKDAPFPIDTSRRLVPLQSRLSSAAHTHFVCGESLNRVPVAPHIKCAIETLPVAPSGGRFNRFPAALSRA